MDGTRRFGNLMSHALLVKTVGFHHITWRATASAVSNVDAVVDALAWLVNDTDAVETDKSSSYHGPEMTLITATTSNKRKAMHSFSRLGEANIRTLMDAMDERLDGQNILHFRLSLDALIDGHVVLAGEAQGPTVKGQAKLEVYSGKPAGEQRLATLNEALELSKGSDD